MKPNPTARQLERIVFWLRDIVKTLDEIQWKTPAHKGTVEQASVSLTVAAKNLAVVMKAIEE